LNSFDQVRQKELDELDRV